MHPITRSLIRRRARGLLHPLVAALLAVALLFCRSSFVFAAPGDLDPSFSGDGIQFTAFGTSSDYARAMAIQSDGKIVVAGYAFIGSNEDFALARYNTDGSLDTTFDTDGKVTTAIGSSSERIHAIALQSDGKIVVAGQVYVGATTDFGLARYNTDGSLDTTFNTTGKLTTPIGGSNDYVWALAIQSDGKIVAAGGSWNGSNDDFALARYTTAGALDTTFDTDGKLTTTFNTSNELAYGVAIQSDGKIVAAGSGGSSTNSDFLMARYNTNGSLDTTFDTDGKVNTDFGSPYEGAFAMAIQSDGKLVAAGRTVNGSTYDFALARYNTNGSLDTSFDTDGKQITGFGSNNDMANALAIQSDGKIVLAGNANNGSNEDFALARYNADGSLDADFSGDGKQITDFGTGDDIAYALAIQSNGKIIAAGYANNAGSYDFALARYSVNSAPTVANLSKTGSEDNALTFAAANFSAQFTDADGDSLNKIQVTSLPADGTLKLGAVNVALNDEISAANLANLTFTPDADWSGTTSFGWNGHDGTTYAAAEALVNITITDVNDPPTGTDDSLSDVAEDSSALTIPFATLLGNDSAGPADESGQTLTIAGVSAATGGTANIVGSDIVFTPAADYNGVAGFSYSVADDGTSNGVADPKTATATVGFTITPISDAPVAADGSLTTDEDTLASSALNATDADGDSLTYSIVTNGTKGVVTITNLATGAYTYTPNANVNGSDSFTFKVNDGTTDSNVATVSVTITPVNDAPVATNGSLTATEDTPASSTLSASDLEGGSLTYSLVADGTKGSATVNADGTYTYTPNANTNGSDSFTFKVSDGTTDSNVATVSVTITEVNDPPTGTDDSLSDMAEDSGAQTIPFATLLGNDMAGPANESSQALTIASAGSAVGGTVNIVGSDVIFTPNANYNGPGAFSYTVTDDGTTNGAADPKTASGNVTFMVTPVNDAPVANTGSLTINEDTPASSTLSASDTDGDSLTYSIVANGSKGVVAITNAATGAYTYTPNANTNGSDSFTFKANDGTADSNVATISVTITPVSDAPVATDGSLTTNEDTLASSALNATDADGDSLIYSLVANGSKGVATITNARTGAYTYTPNANANGTDSFTFQASDDTALAFDGVNDYAVAPLNAGTLTQLTVEMWVKPTTVASKGIFQWANGLGSNRLNRK